MPSYVQKVEKERLSPIEVFMARRESMVEKNRAQNADQYDDIVLDGIRTAYGINRKGDVFSYKNNRLLKPAIIQGKRKIVICYEKGESRCYQGIWVDRLVALTYIPNPNNCKYIRHKNYDPMDDSAENLEWTDEKPNGSAGYSKEDLANMFSLVNSKYNDPPTIIAKELNVKEWVVVWIKMVIRHMSDSNIEISPDIFLSGFETPVVDGIPNERYLINRFGILFQKFGERYRIGSISPFGYTTVTLVGVSHLCMMHRIVAETFLPNPNNLVEVHHKNGITCDPCVWNLEWVTHQENMSEAKYLGQLKRGNDRSHTTNTDDQIHMVCRLLCEMKLSMTEIAEATGVNYNVIKGIRRGEAWQHISQYYRIPYAVFYHGKFHHEDKTKTEMVNRRIHNVMTRSEYNMRNYT